MLLPTNSKYGMLLKLKAFMNNAKPENRPVIRYAGVHKFCFVLIRFRYFPKKVNREDIQN